MRTLLWTWIVPVSLAALAACATSNPEVIAPVTTVVKSNPNASRILGLLEVTLDFSDERNPIGTANFKPRSGQGLSARAISAGGNETSQIRLVRNTVSFIDANESFGTQTRYVRGTFDIANFSPLPFNNLNFIATNLPGTTQQGTMFTSLRNGADAVIPTTDTLPGGENTYRGIKPTHGMKPTQYATVVDSSFADLQYFTPNEISNVQSSLNSVYPGLQPLEYGFVARNFASSGNQRSIDNSPVNQDCSSTLTNPPNGYTFVTNDNSCFEGQVTFAFKFPRKPIRSANPFAFSFVFVVADESTSIVSQSLEDQVFGTVAGSSAAGVSTFAQVRTLLNSGYAGANRKCVNGVRTALNPDAFLGALATPGSLDGCFGTGGKVTTSISPSFDEAYAIAIQSDGKFVVAGGKGGYLDRDFALARYNTNGGLDTTFGTGGKVITTFAPSDDAAYGIAIQSDGKILLAGGSSFDFAIARYNTNGSLDTTFDTDGKVITPITPNTTAFQGEDFAKAIAIQNDGKIVLAGKTYNGPDLYSAYDFALARYNTNGSLDTTFDTDGIVTTTFGVSSSDEAHAIAIQIDGKILVSGGSDGEFALARYNSNGSLDPTFDTDGKVTTPTVSNAYDIAVQSDGKIVLAGRSYNGTNYDFALARYNTNGSLDTTFDTDGKVITPIGSSADFAYDIAIQSDGKIVLAGESYNGTDYDFALARYNTNGSLDAIFGTGGKVTTTFGSSSSDRANGMVIQSDGKIVLAGESYNGTPDDFALARYNP
jgi:uncharacterized delta-60 repeat protein